MQKFSFSLLIALVVSIGVSFIDGVNYECERLSENVIRLHVIANSDSILDQDLKLKVRDRVLEFDFLNNLTNKQSAKQVLEENLDFIKSEVEKTLLENGCAKSVTAESVSMLFPIKRYENFTMPAGVYDALRITIGNGEGKNWWCVMFPPLCYGACIGDKDVEAVIGNDGVGLMEKSVKYEVRFKIVEWFKKMFDKKSVRYEK